jgi:DNA-binding response OmpR family regulator
MEPLPRLVVIHGQRSVADFLEAELSAAGFAVRAAEDAGTGFGLVRDWDPQLVLLDVKLPGIDGIALLKLLRHHTSAPIVMLGIELGLQERLASLESGADQCVSLPASISELTAILRTALRRPSLRDRSTLVFGEILLDLRGRSVVRSGRSVALTRREFDVLAALLAEPGRVFTRDDLLADVWGGSSTAGRKAVDACILGLRRKIDLPFPTPIVQTVRGIGFTVRRRAES